MAAEIDLEDERRLCESAQDGDRDALGTLLTRHGPRLYRAVLLPRLGSAAAAEEALSTTYIKVVEKFHQFTWQNVGVYPWLRVVAMRVALDALRARKREVLFEPSDLEREIDDADRNAHRDPEVLERHDLALARQRVNRPLSSVSTRATPKRFVCACWSKNRERIRRRRSKCPSPPSMWCCTELSTR